MEMVNLRVATRGERGKEEVARLRRDGRVPAVFYGRGEPTVSMALDEREFVRHLGRVGSGAHLIQFTSDVADLQGRVALVKDVQRHPLSGAILHVDFYAVDLTRAVKLPVPLRFVGKAEGVALGGILQPVQREVEVECLPTDIPEFIEIDVTALGIHDAIHVTDIILPPGVRAVYETNYTLVTVLAPTVEEVAPAPAEAEAAAVEPGAAPAEGAAPVEKKEEAGED